MPRKYPGKEAPIPEGWKAAEEIAIAADRSVATVTSIANELNIPSVNYPGHRRRRFSPPDVQRIMDVIAQRDRSHSSQGQPPDQGNSGQGGSSTLPTP